MNRILNCVFIAFYQRLIEFYAFVRQNCAAENNIYLGLFFSAWLSKEMIQTEISLFSLCFFVEQPQPRWIFLIHPALRLRLKGNISVKSPLRFFTPNISRISSRPQRRIIMSAFLTTSALVTPALLFPAAAYGQAASNLVVGSGGVGGTGAGAGAGGGGGGFNMGGGGGSYGIAGLGAHFGGCPSFLRLHFSPFHCPQTR